MNGEYNSSCQTCASRSDYSNLAGTTNYSCDQACLCRNTRERSDKDIMDYNYYVLNKPMNLKPYNTKPPVNYSNNVENYFVTKRKKNGI